MGEIFFDLITHMVFNLISRAAIINFKALTAHD